MRFSRAAGYRYGRYVQGEASGRFSLCVLRSSPSRPASWPCGPMTAPRCGGYARAAFRRAGGKPPLIILHAGLGAADRDGNNYNVPGRNDALGQLARALAALGVASYRYDKRGSGQSTWLVRGEEELSFEAWVLDLAAAIVAILLGRIRVFSGVDTRHERRRLVAAAAANAGRRRPRPGHRVRVRGQHARLV